MFICSHLLLTALFKSPEIRAVDSGVSFRKTGAVIAPANEVCERLRDMRQRMTGWSDQATIGAGVPLPVQLPVRFSMEESDGALSDVKLYDDRVAITSKPGGAEITQLIPMRDFVGVVVGVNKVGESEHAFVALRHKNGKFGQVGDIPLTVTQDDSDVEGLLSYWREWAEILYLPAFVEMPEGKLEPAGKPPACVDMYPAFPRRRDAEGRGRRR